MDGLIMDYELTLNSILRRAETIYGEKEVVSQLPDKSIHRYTYADMAVRARKLSVALSRLGVRPGDRVATFAWNSYRHLEAYFGIPAGGAVLHTLNILLHPDDIAYIINHAGDRVVLIDDVLLSRFEKVLPQIDVDHIIVMSDSDDTPDDMLSYEDLLAAADPKEFQEPHIDERQAAAMCYTSGTTGRPKGVVYSHRALTLHSLAQMGADMFGIRERDIVLPVVPMFHANAWGLPFTCAMTGAAQVFPGPFLDAESIISLIERERVTFAAGVPTIWLGMLQYLDQHKDSVDVSTVNRTLVGGQAVPAATIRAFKDRHGIDVIHAWGMTETAPLGTVTYVPSMLNDAPEDVRLKYLSMQGRPAPLVELRIRAGGDIVPWDGESMGEVEVRGPWVASGYYNDPDSAEKFTDDGWLRTGDIAAISALGYMEIKDRAKDVIKSGGEWISSIALENQLMAHPAVAEAAVVAAEHPKWLERPVAAVVLKSGAAATEQELRDFLAPHFAKWWLPDAILFVDAIPRTSTGKFMKRALRDRYSQVLLERAENSPQTVAGQR
ncbi:MAG: long-chain fatty acid--CoA ligase [Nitrolancea sp.]